MNQNYLVTISSALTWTTKGEGIVLVDLYNSRADQKNVWHIVIAQHMVEWKNEPMTQWIITKKNAERGKEKWKIVILYSIVPSVKFESPFSSP